MKVFISHSSKDKPVVETLANDLSNRGFEVWLDKWEIAPGDNIVDKINSGLEAADAGLIVFSVHSADSNWVRAEISYLTYEMIGEKKLIIPVMAGEDAYIPALLRPLARIQISETQTIADALRHRRPGPPKRSVQPADTIENIRISLISEGETGFLTEVRIGDQLYASEFFSSLPESVASGWARFLSGFSTGMRLIAPTLTRTQLEKELVEFGHALGRICLPGNAASAISDLIAGCRVGTTVRICFESNNSRLLALPFEAVRLPQTGQLLAIQKPVVTYRRPTTLGEISYPQLAGPVKVLVAVGAPDEGLTTSTVLDHERELQNILDSLEDAVRLENFQVRLLEVGHPEQIGEALACDNYHILHISAHGSPELLELEDEDGRPHPTTASELTGVMTAARRSAPPIVFLNTCKSGADNMAAASFSESLLRRGIPLVIAMQTGVSDYYATRLAGEFYRQIAQGEPKFASRALARARAVVEAERQEKIRLAHTPDIGNDEILPEYATATLFLAGNEIEIADTSRGNTEPLGAAPVRDHFGELPALRMGDLIGRRRELRLVLNSLREKSSRVSGVVITGVGGIGKSALAGRVMQRMKESGFLIAVNCGMISLNSIGSAIGFALKEQGKTAKHQQDGDELLSGKLDDEHLIRLIRSYLLNETLLLVFDDFEQNLKPAGVGFHNEDLKSLFEEVIESVQKARILVTCRYPVPELGALLERVAIGPLTQAETRKLLLRLAALNSQSREELSKILPHIGGHPRILEFLDALLSGGRGRLVHVTSKLKKLRETLGIEPNKNIQSLNSTLGDALLLGERDILLEELVGIARDEGVDSILFQLAVSNLPVSSDELTLMLNVESLDQDNIKKAAGRLQDLSLLHIFPDQRMIVHR